jgi:PAS domain S-box-containing protein
MNKLELLDRTPLITAKAEPFDIVGQSVIGTAPDGTIVFWNEAAIELYGWRTEDVLGRNIVDITPSAQQREQAAAIMARLSAGETWSGYFMVRRRDGRQFLAEVRDVPVFDDTGELVGVLGISKAV